MVVKKKSKLRREPVSRTVSRDIPLRSHAADALHTYFQNLNGHRPAQLYDLVMREVEEPLFKAVLDYAEGNQSPPRSSWASIAALCARNCGRSGSRTDV
jgi:Fis family transcriptional regulator